METTDIQWVYVSNVSKQDALKCKDKRIFIYTLPWNCKYKYICVCWGGEEKYLNGKIYIYSGWAFAVPIPKEKKKERKLLLTDSEWENVQNILNVK